MARPKATTGAPGALEFEATLTGVRPVIAKKDQYGQGTAGKLEVTFAIPQPPEPRPANVPYAIVGSRGVGIRKRPEAPTQKKGEADPTFEQRKLQHEHDLGTYDSSLVKYQADQRRYEREAGAYQARLMAYAQLVGLAAVFGNTELRVVVHPKTSLLAGFGVQLLALPAETVDEKLDGLAGFPRGADILLDGEDDYPDDHGGPDDVEED